MDRIKILEGLSEAREKMVFANKGIGEPCVEVPAHTLLVQANSPLKIHMRMDHLIDLIAQTLE